MVASRPASAVVVVETVVNRSRLVTVRNWAAAEVVTVVVEIVPTLNRPTAPSIPQLVEEVARAS